MHSLKILALAAALACTAAAQTATPKAPSQTEKTPAHPAAPAAENPNEPVITIRNLCVTPKPAAECKTVVTKAEFEKLLGAIRANIPPSARMQIAQKYVQLLTFANKAEREGLEKSPEVQEQLKLMKMQALAGAFTRNLEEKYAKASDAEVQKYYQENKPAYEEINLKRIYIPKPVANGDKKPLLDEAATKALADKIQSRAAAGEDFDKLAQEAFTTQNPDAAKTPPPPTSIGPRRHGHLPQDQEAKLFDLKAGEVSPVMEEPSGFFIYKVQEKDVLPFDKVKAQIAKQLEEQKMRDAIDQAVNSVKPSFNESYFKVPPGSEAEPADPHGMGTNHPPVGANPHGAAPPPPPPQSK